MICPFCENEMRFNSYNHTIQNYIYKQWGDYSCTSPSCWVVDGDFPRYRCGISVSGVLAYEEYALGNLFVKVNIWNKKTYIYKTEACMLLNEIEIPCLIWLNVKNKRATLNKLRVMVIFS